MIFSSPAKINLSLKIIRKRSDGFHDIDSDFQFLNWGDKIEISPSNKLSVSTTKIQVSQQENLVTQALKKIESFCDAELNYSVKIEKNIPLGSGLGGGSSNAATAMLAINSFAKLNLSLDVLIELGKSLGSDIPFFLKGLSGKVSGKGEIIVVEADEFDRSFLALKPTISIVTNIELEHTDCYSNLKDLKKAFIQFCKSIPFYGESIVCIDSPAVREILPYIERPMTTYGRSRDAAYRAKNLRFHENKSTYTVFRAEECLGEIELNVPGEHNILNSLAAVTLGLEMGLSFKSISKGIQSYSGVRRRFDIKGVHNEIFDWCFPFSRVIKKIFSTEAITKRLGS